MKTLILDNYDSFTYNLYQYCAELKGNPVVFRNNALKLKDIGGGGYTHIIISPGPGSPDKKGDFGICGNVIKRFAGKLPILGVCLGHQGIIHEFGGRIIRAPVPVHGKRSLIIVNNKNPLFHGLPETIEAMRYHSLVGDSRKIPDEFKIIAETKEDKLIMGITHKTLPLFGVQFHPESIGTPEGKKILQNFLKIKMPAAEDIFYKMAGGKMNEKEMEKILREMAQRGESVSEIIGFAAGMRKYAKKLPIRSRDLMDTCGTGGSGLPRMNISTTATFVLAALNVKIAKHGNRAASGRCGSFDLLEELGVNINMPTGAIAAAVEKIGIGFIFAPAFHPAMKFIAPVRKKLGIRTIFNLLGPLTNPAKPKYHLLGINSVETAGKIIRAMKDLGYTRAMVVSGEDGLDDVTLCGKTHIFELNRGKIRAFDFTPEQIGLKCVKNFKNIAGGNTEKNAELFIKLLKAKAPADLQNLLYLNAGFGLVIRGFARDVAAGFKMARQIVTSGKAYEKFIEYKNFSRRFLPFVRAINGKKIVVIAEVKRASPSHGKFPIKSVEKLVRAYEKNGAAAISVVTEPKLFNGSLKLLQEVRGYTRLPILRKDFIKKAEQIDESAKLGADAILLIAKILTKVQLKKFSERALSKNIVPVIEIHNENDLKKIAGITHAIIGINNRDLKTFKTNVNHAKSLLRKIRKIAEFKNAPIIIESGFFKPEELKQYKNAASAALIGTALLTSKNPSKTLTQFIHAGSSK
ncbi:anthranilate phosphoribosyltransferase [Candidatus Peregrinibacteria bacterium]|nr:anthranilate phosphoribosyltransferase [Candidatus Peregrinibacteria bacterium]